MTSRPEAPPILIATSNAGKLRDFAAAASRLDVSVGSVPDLESIPPAVEDAPTFEANAAKKAEHYSRYALNALVLADDSGLCVHALHDAPGVHSARYAAFENGLAGNSSDSDNNARLLREMTHVADSDRAAEFVCVIAVAYNGNLQACFRGSVAGIILHEPRGSGGFGYDPLFFVEKAGKTFAELAPEEKGLFSHRGQAFEKFLRWYTERLKSAWPT